MSQVDDNTKILTKMKNGNGSNGVEDEADFNARLNHCDSELKCIRTDLGNFNRINKEFLGLAKSKMASFDERIVNSENSLEAKLREFRYNQIKNL